MDTQQYWDLIDEARRTATDAADAGAVAERAAALLAARPRAEILGAQQAFWDLMADSYRAELWAAAYLVNGGCSDDGFEYFRGWLVLQGREVFERAVAEPDSLAALPAVRTAAADGEELECEDALGIAWEAHRTAAGEDLPDGCFTITYPAIQFDRDFEDEAETARRLPCLAALFAQD
ncbi:DUF4240 domain-containing protein [Kitasatospora sp. NPDC059571]|uniref:DUF4240 domain-containing protein n=1 Tax=Kitasatospora sp. NPDC059571 TaxID=3346871 RepID=UPI0036D02C3B